MPSPTARFPIHVPLAAGNNIPSRTPSPAGAHFTGGARRPFAAPARVPSPASHTFMDLLESSNSFMHYMVDDQQRNLPENSHFVGTTSHVIQIDGKNEEVRKDTRLIWKTDENVRVTSAWLKHSIDSLSGNNKKGDKYWEDVSKEYNLTTEKPRWRTKTQVKERWHKLNRWTNLFNDCWLKARNIYTSGYSDQMWIDKAHKFYEEENNGSHFVFMDVWNMVRNEAKWLSYNDRSNQNKRKEMDNSNPIVDEGEDIELPRPIGQKAAKKAAFEANGKVAKKAVFEAKGKERRVDELDRFEKIQNGCHANRMKVLEMQQKISNDKIEASKLSLQAAKDEKEAKLLEKESKMLEKESKMLETYSCLLKQDMSAMPDEIRAEHIAALKSLRKKLFPDS
ncbi:Ribosomal protein-like [Zea mays]|uniref:Ribosomal protein-like n=1 Tax=Zea mays TaxID=4577 RepID=A0A1D6FUU1_MAIZE|nr:Ribosomal protein-like [Zea mays]